MKIIREIRRFFHTHQGVNPKKTQKGKLSYENKHKI